MAGGLAFGLHVYLYVYVVIVNKGTAFLWITSVYQKESVICRTHNRMHSVCGRRVLLRTTFWTRPGARELPRLRPHRFHMSCACFPWCYPQARVDNFSWSADAALT